MLNNLVPNDQSERHHFEEEKSKLMTKLYQLRVAEESMWKQKSRVMWLREWNSNTAYFIKWHIV